MRHHWGTNATLLPLWGAISSDTGCVTIGARTRRYSPSYSGSPPSRRKSRMHDPLGGSQFDIRREDHRHRPEHRRAPNGLTWRVMTNVLQHPRRTPSNVASVRVLPRSAVVARIHRRCHLPVIHAALSMCERFLVKALRLAGLSSRRQGSLSGPYSWSKPIAYGLYDAIGKLLI